MNKKSDYKTISIGFGLICLFPIFILLKVYNYSSLLFLFSLYCIPIGNGLILNNTSEGNKLTDILLRGISSISICASLPALSLIIVEDPFNWFINIENIFDFQLVGISGFIACLCLSFIDFKSLLTSNKKVIWIISIIAVIIGFSSYYLYKVPDRSNKKILPINEFKEKLVRNDYIINEVSNLEDINITNSKILFAKQDETYIYYIESNSIKDAINNYSNISNHNSSKAYSDCDFNNNYQLDNKNIYWCDNKDYFIMISRVKNTIIYAESNIKNRNKIEKIFSDFGY